MNSDSDSEISDAEDAYSTYEGPIQPYMFEPAAAVGDVQSSSEPTVTKEVIQYCGRSSQDANVW